MERFVAYLWPDAAAKTSFTALVGASGSGKSSVVLAGLAPRLSAQGGWRSTYFRIGMEPDKNPFAALARALEPLTGERCLSDRLEEVQKLAQKLAAGSISLTNAIGQCRAANPGKRILLIADQFEEAFAFVPDEALRNRFIDALIDAFPDPERGATPYVWPRPDLARRLLQCGAPPPATRGQAAGPRRKSWTNDTR